MKIDDYTDRLVWRLSVDGYDEKTIARLVGLTETDVLRILQGLRQKNEEEQRP